MITREEKFKNFFKEKDIGAIIFFRPDEILMATGYYPVWGVSFCLYPSKGNPIIYNPKIEPKKSFPSNAVIREFPFGVINADPWKTIIEMIKEDLRKLGLEDKKITYINNVVGGALPAFHGEIPPMKSEIKEELAKLTQAGFEEMDSELLSLYECKTLEEIKKIVITHEVAKIGVKTFFSNLKEGITEGELSGIVELAIKKTMNSGDRRHACGWCYIHSGENTSYSGEYAQSTSRKLKKDDTVLMELGVCVNGYWADITRTGYIGKKSEEYEKVFKLIEDAKNIAIEHIKPGMHMKKIDELARNKIKEEGYGEYFNHSLGHQVGFRYHDPNYAINPFSEGILKEGMIVTIEPGVYLKKKKFGVRIEENVLVTKDGYSILSMEGD